MTEIWNSLRYNPSFLRKWKKKSLKLMNNVRISMNVG